MATAKTEIPDKFFLNSPQLLTENFLEEFKVLDYKGETDDIKERLKHKLFKIWELWDRFSKDETLAKLMNNIPKDVSSDEFKVKQILLFTYEQIAYILKSTDIVEEMLEGVNIPELIKASVAENKEE